MLLVTMMFGALFGVFAALTAVIGFGLSVFGAFGLYMTCALAPVLLILSGHALKLGMLSQRFSAFVQR